MPSNEMEIILTLVDNATKEMKSAMEGMTSENKAALKDLQGELEKSKKRSEESTTAMKKGFDDAAKTVRQFKRDLLLVASAVTAVYQSVKTYARYNEEARKALNEFDKSMMKLATTTGPLAVKALDLLTQSAKGWLMIKAFLTGQGEEIPLIASGQETDEVSKMIAAQQNMEMLNQKVKDAELLYKAGGISAQEFYNIISSEEARAVSIRTEAIEQMRQMEELSATVSNSQLMHARTLSSEQNALLKEYQTNFQIAHSRMAGFVVMLSQGIRNNLSSALTDVIMRTKTSKEAFNELGQTMIRMLVEYMMQRMIAAVLEKTLLASTVSTNVAAGLAVSAAWAQAALYVSLATMGANAAGAAAGIAATAGALAGAGALVTAVGTAQKVGAGAGEAAELGGGQSWHRGGYITAHQGLAVDEVPAILQTGEGVLSRRGMSALGGVPTLNALNGGNALSGVNISIQINNPTVQNQGDIDDLVNAISDRLARETERYY